MTSNADKLDSENYDSLLDSYQALQAQTALLTSHNNQLQQQLSLRSRVEKDRWQHMKIIQEMTIAISSSIELDQVLDTVAKQTAKLLKINTCTIMLLEPPNELVWIASVGRPEEIQRLGRQKMNEGLSGWVATNQQTLQVENVVEHELLLNPRLAKSYGYCTYLGIPMLIREKLIGVIEVFSKHPVRFAEEEVQILEVVAGHTAVAVEKAQLFRDIRQRVEEMEWQNRVTLAMSKELDAPQALHQLSASLANALGATSTYISELKQKQTMVLVSEYWAATAVKEEIVEEIGTVFPTKDFPTFVAVLKDGKSRTIYADTETISPTERQIFLRYKVQTILLMPIIRGDITYGIVSIWDSLQKRTYSEREKHLASSIIQHAAGIIENARLFEKVRNQATKLEQEVNIRTTELLTTNHKLRKEIQERLRIEDELQSKTDSLLVMSRIADTIYQVFNIEVVYQHAVDVLVEYPKFAGALILLLDKEAEMVKAVARSGFKEHVPASESQVSLHDSLVGHAIKQAEIIQSRDFNKDTRITNVKKTRLMIEGFGGMVAVPILHKGVAIGAVNVLLNHKDGITKVEEEMLLSISKTIGLAILNAEYVTQIEMEIDERHQVEEALQIYMSELKRSNLELQEFAYIASHDLQEPLRKIQAFGDRLTHRYTAQLDDRGLDYLDRMQQAAGRLRVLIDNLLLFSQVTTAAQPFTEVDLNEVVAIVLSDLDMRINETETEIVVNQLPIIEAESSQMHQLLQNLVGNALKFMQPDKRPKIQIMSKSTQGRSLASGRLNQQEMVQIIVKDNGIGIEEKYQERIFQLFERLHSRQTYEGTGIGLAICRKIVDRHNGRISVQSELGKGTTFIINLPTTQTNL